MKDIDIERLKKQVNIVDVIGGFIPLKKQGKDYWACCPFHGEKTPSFSVSEEKQMYYCFGCGATGDVVKFLMEYNGWDFRQAAKHLGADIDSKPLAVIKKNEQRQTHRYRLPPDHKDLNADKLDKILDGAMGVLTITTPDGELVNVYDLHDREFAAGGPSYNGGHWIIKNDKREALVVNDYTLGHRIASIYPLNVVVCFTGAVMKYLCLWNKGDWKLKPVLTNECDDFLSYEMPWLFWDGERLEKRGVEL